MKKSIFLIFFFLNIDFSSNPYILEVAFMLVERIYMIRELCNCYALPDFQNVWISKLLSQAAE